MILSSVYVLASYLLLTRGLPGTGRIFLMVFPVLSTVLLGTMAGWIAAGVSSAVVVARALLGWAGVAILPPLELESRTSNRATGYGRRYGSSPSSFR